MYILKYKNGQQGFFYSYREAKQTARSLRIKKFVIVRAESYIRWAHS